MADIRETAITVDHETGRVRVDTTSNKVKNRLKTCGFQDITRDAQLGPYSSWVGYASQVWFRRKPRATGRVSGAAASRVKKSVEVGQMSLPRRGR